MRTMLLATLLAVGIGAPAYAQKYTCSESRMIGDAIAELRDKGQTLAEFDASIDADSDTPEGKNETKSLAKAIYGFGANRRPGMACPSVRRSWPTGP
jgi:hypothetical protein